MATKTGIKNSINSITTVNPANGEEIAVLDTADSRKITQAVQAARQAFQEWKNQSYQQRGSFLANAAEFLLRDLEKIASTITTEMGKPINESRSEVGMSANYLKYFAHNASEILRDDEIDLELSAFPKKTASISHEPVGVVAAIKPWNLPLLLPVWTIGAALAAGNSVIFKPSQHTPLVALELEKAFLDAHLPKEVFQVLIGADETGQALVSSDVDMVSFTGSAKTGRKVAAKCGSLLKKVSLELGGKDPLIIWNDADLNFAVAGTVYGSFSNCGQFCCSVERVYVHEDIGKAFVEKVVNKTLELKLGPGSDGASQIGPLANEQQLAIVENHVEDAIASGAKVLVGGKRPTGSKVKRGFFFEPTVLVDVNHDMRIMREETFGPICPIMTVSNEDEAIRLANDTQYGMSAYVFSQDEGLIERLSSRLDVGMVWANETVLSLPECPWIVRKDSGTGAELGKMGMLRYTLPKVVNTQLQESANPRPWWFPAQA